MNVLNEVTSIPAISIKANSITLYNYQINKKRIIMPFEGVKGTISETSQRKIKLYVNNFINIQEYQNINIRKNIAFITLTLPTKQNTDDKDIKRNCLNPLLTELKKLKNIKYYIWVAEKQKNENIHFHLLIDRNVDYTWLRNRWNYYIEKYGYVTEYQNKYNKLSYEEYKLQRLESYVKYKTTLTGSQLDEKIKKAYNYGQSTNWLSPNTTDIHSLQKLKNIASYIAKYMSKTEQKEDGNKEKLFNGRFWGASRNLKICEKTTDFQSEEYEKDIEQLIVNGKCRYVQDKFYTTIFVDYQKMKKYTINILKQYEKLLQNSINYTDLPDNNVYISDNLINNISNILSTKTNKITESCKKESINVLPLQQIMNFSNIEMSTIRTGF